jgi:t-SNARE complex subunit (syntaxin)
VCGGSQADPDVVDPNASNAVPGERQLERTEGHPRCLAVEAMARLDSQGCGVIIIISIFTIVIIIIIISVLFLLLVNFIIMLYNYYRVLQKKQPST